MKEFWKIIFLSFRFVNLLNLEQWNNSGYWTFDFVILIQFRQTFDAVLHSNGLQFRVEADWLMFFFKKTKNKKTYLWLT